MESTYEIWKKSSNENDQFRVTTDRRTDGICDEGDGLVGVELDWLQSFKQVFINLSYHIH